MNNEDLIKKIAELEQQIAEKDRRIAELEAQLNPVPSAEKTKQNYNKYGKFC